MAWRARTHAAFGVGERDRILLLPSFELVVSLGDLFIGQEQPIAQIRVAFQPRANVVVAGVGALQVGIPPRSSRRRVIFGRLRGGEKGARRHERDRECRHSGSGEKSIRHRNLLV